MRCNERRHECRELINRVEKRKMQLWQQAALNVDLLAFNGSFVRKLSVSIVNASKSSFQLPFEPEALITDVDGCGGNDREGLCDSSFP